MKYLWLFVIIIVIILIICVVVFGVNFGDNNYDESNQSSNVSQNKVPKPRQIEKSRVTVELADSGDKVLCSERPCKNKDGFDLEFRMCVKKRYDATYVVKNLCYPYKDDSKVLKSPPRNKQHYEGDAVVVSHKDDYPSLKCYLDYNVKDNYYVMKIVDSDNEVVTFDQWLRCTTIRATFYDQASKDDNSRRSSLSYDDDQESHYDNSEYNYDYSDPDVIDPYDQTDHCGSNSDWEFYSSPSECKGRSRSVSSSHD